MLGTGVVGYRVWLHNTCASPISFAGHHSLGFPCLHHVQGIISALFKDVLPCQKSVI